MSSRQNPLRLGRLDLDQYSPARILERVSGYDTARQPRSRGNPNVDKNFRPGDVNIWQMAKHFDVGA